MPERSVKQIFSENKSHFNKKSCGEIPSFGEKNYICKAWLKSIAIPTTTAKLKVQWIWKGVRLFKLALRSIFYTENGNNYKMVSKPVRFFVGVKPCLNHLKCFKISSVINFISVLK